MNIAARLRSIYELNVLLIELLHCDSSLETLLELFNIPVSVTQSRESFTFHSRLSWFCRNDELQSLWNAFQIALRVKWNVNLFCIFTNQFSFQYADLYQVSPDIKFAQSTSRGKSRLDQKSLEENWMTINFPIEARSSLKLEKDSSYENRRRRKNSAVEKC